jgi:hypothetical protein
VVGGGVDGPRNLRDPGVLGQVTPGARLERIENRRFIGVRGQDHDLGVRLRRPDPPGRLDPVEPGHPQVHQYDVGAMASAQRHRLLTVTGGGDWLDVGRGIEQGHEAFPDHRLVVHDHHPDGAVHRISRPARADGGAGSRSSTRHPPFTRPALRVPPSNSARSRIPRTP